MKALAVFTMSAAMLLAAQIPNLDIIQLQNGPCDLDGTAKAPDSKALNLDKNRYHPPGEDDIDTSVSLAAMLAPGDDLNRFSAKKAARITGFVIDVKMGGNETCNCKATDINSRDTHIELALAKNAPEVQRVIVEVTPRLRKLKHDASPSVDWTTKSLQKTSTGIKGKWVEVTGWMVFDTAHISESENTNPGNARNWRATGWEIHPVTEIRVLPAAPPLPDLQPELFANFQRAHAAQFDRSPQARQALLRRNQRYLDRLDREDLDDELPEPGVEGAAKKDGR